MTAIKNVFPALSARPHCRKHNWPTTPIPTRRARQAGHTLVGVLAHWIDSLRIKRVRLVAASRIPTRSLEHLGKPTACLRTMHWRTLCGPPNPAAGVALWVVAGCFRHCGRHDAHRGAAGQPWAWHQYPDRIQRRGDPLSTVGQYQVGKYLCDRWLPTPHP